MVKCFLTAILGLICIAPSALAAPTTARPVLASAQFDSQGRLLVKVARIGQSGCYLSLLGGLEPKKITTGITAIQVSERTHDPVRIRTIRKYRCPQRTLYLRILRECYTDPIGSARSNSVALSVPKANQ